MENRLSAALTLLSSLPLVGDAPYAFDGGVPYYEGHPWSSLRTLPAASTLFTTADMPAATYRIGDRR